MLRRRLQRIITHSYPSALMHVAAHCYERQLLLTTNATVVITDDYLGDSSAHKVLAAARTCPIRAQSLSYQAIQVLPKPC